MDKNKLLKNLQQLFKTTKDDINFMKNEAEFREALSSLDAETLKEVIGRGFSVSEYELEHGSTLVRVLYDSSDMMLSVFKKYWPKKYVEYYYNVLPTMNKNNLPEQVKSEMNSVINALTNVMDVLYNNGADINARNFRDIEDSVTGVLLEKTKQVETSSSFGVAIKLLDYFQSAELVGWFTDKKGFDINANESVLSDLIRSDSDLSTEVMNTLLISGLKLTRYTVISSSDEYSSLHECAMVGGPKTQKDKMHLLYQFASAEQKSRYMEDCELIISAQNEKQNELSK